MDPESAAFKLIEGDTKIVLASEPRPQMWWPQSYIDENYIDEYYMRCIKRLFKRLPSFIDVHHVDYIKDQALLRYLIAQTPADYFRPEDLEEYKNDIEMRIMENKLKGKR